MGLKSYTEKARLSLYNAAKMSPIASADVPTAWVVLKSVRALHVRWNAARRNVRSENYPYEIPDNRPETVACP